jgi:cytidylate kinase
MAKDLSGVGRIANPSYACRLLEEEVTPMKHFSSVGRITEALAGAQSHWHAQGKEAGNAAPAITIALTREAGCPGTSVAREVATRLGWPVYDHELLERIAEEMGLRVSLLESVDERRRSWLLESVEALSTAPNISEAAYVRRLAETLLSLGAHGACVIVGRGAAQILPVETTLRVRLVGLLEDRIAATGRRLGISRNEAARHVEETDRQRVAFIKAHFLNDPTDPRQYDLLLNTSRWSIAHCAELIIEAFQRFQGHSPGARGG